jgi:uncharacterized hydrophobic protein (TIGR00271 family)
VIHLRLVVPSGLAEQVLDLLTGTGAVSSVVHLPGAAAKPPGDLVLCDVAREQASVVVGDLRQLGLEQSGSIAIQDVPTVLSDAAEEAQAAAPDMPFGDQVVWEDVEERTSEETALSINFVEFMLIAGVIAAFGVLLDQPVLIVGAMVVGPEFGPLAALCVAVVQRRADLARRSFLALAVGFAVTVPAVYLVVGALRGLGVAPAHLPHRPLTAFVSHPDVFSALVAYVAGTAGILSLTSAKSGALVGVLISVTTLPAAADAAVAASYRDWSEARGAAAQLAVNLACIVAGGLARLVLQRRVYAGRVRRTRATTPS